MTSIGCHSTAQMMCFELLSSRAEVVPSGKPLPHFGFRDQYIGLLITYAKLPIIVNVEVPT